MRMSLRRREEKATHSARLRLVTAFRARLSEVIIATGPRHLALRFSLLRLDVVPSLTPRNWRIVLARKRLDRRRIALPTKGVLRPRATCIRCADLVRRDISASCGTFVDDGRRFDRFEVGRGAGS